MNCEQVRQLWHDRLDGLSDSTAEAECEAHLSACTSCRVWREQMRQVAGALDELRIETDRVGRNPSHDHEGVVASIGRSDVRRPAAWWAFGRIAAGIALMIAAGSYVYKNRTSSGDRGLTTARVNDPPALLAPVRASMVLTGPSATEYISVRHETSSPNVHVFRLYRAYKRPDIETSES